MAGSSPGDSRPKQPRSIALFRRLPALVCAAGLAVAAGLLLHGFIAGARFFGEGPTPAQLHQQVSDGRWAAVVALASTGAGLLLGWRRRRTPVRVAWGLAVALSVVGVMVAFAPRPATAPTPAGPSHCHEYSGGATRCPGG